MKRITTAAIVLTTLILAGCQEPDATGDAASADAFLDSFHHALFNEDMDTVAASFAADAVIFEGGKREEGLEDYLAHHLAPELPVLATFAREVTKEDLVVRNGVAWYGVEARITGTVRDEPLAMTHATTIAMVHGDSGWKITQIHFSNRRDKKPVEDSE